MVCSMTLGPANPISAFGSARIISPSMAKLAVTPPVVGSVSRENINDAAAYLENGIEDFLGKYGKTEPEKLLEHRYERFRKM